MYASIDKSKEESRDYTTGDIQQHHQFYIPSGDIVFRVENATFKMHSHFLTTQSDVFNDMLSAPREKTSSDGTDENPLVLTDDAVGGWELLLYSIYRSTLTESIEYEGKQILAMLRIAHKYCMGRVEEDLLSKLKREGTPALLDLLLASQLVDSSTLYQQAVEGLISSRPKPTLEEARQIGLRAYHSIMSQSKLRCAQHITGVSCRKCNIVT